MRIISLQNRFRISQFINSTGTRCISILIEFSRITTLRIWRKQTDRKHFVAFRNFAIFASQWTWICRISLLLHHVLRHRRIHMQRAQNYVMKWIVRQVVVVVLRCEYKQYDMMQTQRLAFTRSTQYNGTKPSEDRIPQSKQNKTQKH